MSISMLISDFWRNLSQGYAVYHPNEYILFSCNYGDFLRFLFRICCMFTFSISPLCEPPNSQSGLLLLFRFIVYSF